MAFLANGRRDGSDLTLASPLLPCYAASVSLMATCAHCRREDVLEADLIGDEEKGALRDHLPAVRPKTVQPETLLSPAWHEASESFWVVA